MSSCFRAQEGTQQQPSGEGEASAVPTDLSQLPGDRSGSAAVPSRSSQKTLESHPVSWGAAARSAPRRECYPVPRQRPHSGAACRVRCRSNVSLPAAGIEKPISALRQTGMGVKARAGGERGGRERALPECGCYSCRLAANGGGLSQD